MRKSLNSSILLFTFIVLSSSCTKQQNKQENNNPPLTESTIVDVSLVGHSIMATYPEMKAEITYLSDSVLHWKTMMGDQVAEGDEIMYTKKVGVNLFFVNWVELDGTIVSQVVDFGNHKISVFMTLMNDDNNIGREHLTNTLFEGTFEVAK